LRVVEAPPRTDFAVESALNAIVTLNPKAIETSSVSGRGIGADCRSRFKDTIETAGLRTTSGRVCAPITCLHGECAAVARLKAAGAVVLGKTNAAEMAMDYNADNPVFGRTVHFLDPELTPGGSSGGEAVAIATHMSPGGLGSDLAGSIRMPAHFCGICGSEAGTGRVPGEGQFPPSSGPYSAWGRDWTNGAPVADLRLLFESFGDGAEGISTNYKDCASRGMRMTGVVPVPMKLRGPLRMRRRR
jgi:amidase